MTEFSLNLLKEIPYLHSKIEKIEFENKTKVVIVNIIPNSIIYNLQIFEEGDIMIILGIEIEIKTFMSFCANENVPDF